MYDTSGSLLQAFTLPAASKSSIMLPAGLYIVDLNGKTYKVVVR
ncbi:MAG: T9SS type A sorting domain-containing protein [Tannerella sp.]|nr:T9SS type A sorting domain-containing protein [Tannerella sp.]